MNTRKAVEGKNESGINRQSLRSILQSMPDTIFVLSEEGKVVDYNKGIRQDNLFSEKIIIGHNLTDIFDRKISEDLLTAMNKANLSGEISANEYCLDQEQQIYFEVRLIPLRGSYFLVVARNISDRYKRQAELKASENLYRTVFETTGAATIISRRDTTIARANERFAQLSGYKVAELTGGMSWKQFLYAEDLPMMMEFHHERRRLGGEAPESYETRIIDRDGRIKYVINYVSLIPGTDMSVISMVDITDRKEFEEEIKFHSFHDGLTGLYNRRFFNEELKRLDTERNLPLTIILGDVNGLKLVNDTFGHLTGDQLLQKVAEQIKKGCRDDEIVARVGGDEFAILLSETGNDIAGRIVKRLQESFSGHEVNGIEISVSFGWSSKSKMEQNMRVVFKEAEDMMYKNKLYNYPHIRARNLQTIIDQVDKKFPGEKAYSEKVAAICLKMAKELGFDSTRLEEIRHVGLLHNIGKVTLSGVNLFKPEKLDEIEWIELKRHPETGYRILSSSNDTGRLAEYILTHHENWDGSGYPGGLKGEEIPLQSRILRLADAYTAMSEHRNYREDLTREQIIAELQSNAGIQFDPGLVQLFLEKVLPGL